MVERESHGLLPRPRFDRPTRVLIVVAPFYRDIADALLAGARAASTAMSRSAA
jgi:6,7-dimethyl-8-ribityllumazine synthase